MCGLLDGAFSVSVYIPSKVRLLAWSGVDLEGSGNFLICCNIAAFVRRGWGNHKNPSPNSQNPLCYLNPLPPPSLRPPPSRGD